MNYVSRTQKSIRKISSEALEARTKGVSHVMSGIAMLSSVGNRDLSRDLIASLNYPLNYAVRELSFRNKKKR